MGRKRNKVRKEAVWRGKEEIGGGKRGGKRNKVRKGRCVRKEKKK